jgi:Ca2+-binding EF-hand superfamily protein
MNNKSFTSEFLSSEIKKILHGDVNLNLKKLNKLTEEFIKINPRYNIEERLKFLFRAYDDQKSGEISLGFLQDCIYDLHLCPTADEFVKIKKLFIKGRNKEKKNEMALMKKTKKDKEPDKIKYDDFRILMNALLISGLFRPVSKDLLQEALKKFEHPRQGNILWKDLEEFLISTSDKFNDEELNNFKSFLGINEQKLRFFAHDYINNLLPNQLIKDKEDVYDNLFKYFAFIK